MRQLDQKDLGIDQGSDQNIHAARSGFATLKGVVLSLVAAATIIPAMASASPGMFAATGVACAGATAPQPHFELGASPAFQQSFESWIDSQKSTSWTRLLANINRADTAPGVVVASPSKCDPDYYYHWTRDAALVMDLIVRDYLSNKQDDFLAAIKTYVDFSRANQLSNAQTGLGEPKFYVDGRPFDLPWGRPQNDGPALRALTLIRFAKSLLSDGDAAYVNEKLYRNSLPADTVIKADLEFVAHHWQESSYDLWEEVKGDHFYTRMVQHAALREGAALAHRLGDKEAATFYEQQAGVIQQSLQSFWDPNRGFIQATLNYKEGIHYKGGLDIATILAVFHSGTKTGEFSVTDDRIIATASRLEAAFASLYQINAADRFADAGVAIGRYPEDVYSGGSDSTVAHPWVLATAALAEYHYRLARAIRSVDQVEVNHANVDLFRAAVGPQVGSLKLEPGAVIAQDSEEMKALSQALRKKGDGFMQRIRFHQNPDGSLSEQFHRDTGYMRAARELTWSYASFITASESR